MVMTGRRRKRAKGVEVGNNITSPNHQADLTAQSQSITTQISNLEIQNHLRHRPVGQRVRRRGTGRVNDQPGTHLLVRAGDQWQPVTGAFTSMNHRLLNLIRVWTGISLLAGGVDGGVCHRGTDAVRLRHPASRRRRPGGGKAGQCLQIPPVAAHGIEKGGPLPVVVRLGKRRYLADGCRILQPVVSEQLIDTKRFEVVSVDPALLRERTGRYAGRARKCCRMGFSRPCGRGAAAMR